MISYNVEERKVEESIQQLYRDFALQYSEIQKSGLPESEKQTKINELTENTREAEQILRNTRNLSEISSEDRESLGIKEVADPEVDENLINALVSIYAKRAKIPNEKNRNMGVLSAITLREDETLEEIDTTAFEEELRQYFTEHYADLFTTGYNYFLSKITEVPDDIGILHKKYGDLTQMAMKYGIEPKKFDCFGYQITVQDGLVAEEDSAMGRTNILYATPNGINKRIFDLYSKALYREQGAEDRAFSLDETRELKNTYISYAEKNGIEITNPDVLETIEIDMAKVQGLARYINRVINSRNNVEKGDYTQLFQDDIIRNYSKIMNLSRYNFGDLDSVKGIIRQSFLIDGLYLKLDEDNIICQDEFRPDIAYGTPEFVRAEYQKIMQEVRRLHQTNAFIEKHFDVEKITAKKHAYRRYIQENGITGVDISIPEVKIDHERTGMIADAIMKQYGENYPDPENMKKRILAKLEDKWAEIVTEAQVMNVSELFGEELKEMGKRLRLNDEQLYVKDDFVYLGDFSGFTSNVIYATPEALRKNLAALDSKISRQSVSFEEKRIREGLVKYAEEHKIDMNIPSVESVENKGKAEREMFSFRGGFGMSGTELLPDDPTAREKLELNDSILDVIFKMSNGIPGAIVGITELMKSDDAGVMLLLGLDDMNIRGSQIWEAYKYLYNEDGKKFAEAIKARDEKMVQFINEEMASVGGEKAVTGGASFDRSKTPDKYRFTEEEVEQLKAQREIRIQKQREARDKMIANSPAKKKSLGQKKREGREAKRKAYRARLIAMGKKSIGELDEELTSLQAKEQQAKELCEKYEEQLPEKNDQEL